MLLERYTLLGKEAIRLSISQRDPIIAENPRRLRQPEVSLPANQIWPGADQPVKEGDDVRLNDPLHSAPVHRSVESSQRTVRVAPRPKSG